MKIFFIGLPYFSEKLSKTLSVYDSSLSCDSLKTKSGLLGRLALYFGVLRCDLVYSMSGAIGKKGTNIFDFALALNKKVIMHWVGTDVLDAARLIKLQEFKPSYFHNIRHFCEVEWIRDELEQIGITASVVPFASFDGKISETIDFPDTFSIFTYVSKGREKFYGIDKIIQLAKDFPDIKIKIAGISDYAEKFPTNVILLGWTEDMASQYSASVLYLRLPEHDGLAFSVLEGLANGRYIGYSYPLENTFYISSYELLKELVFNLKTKFENGLLHTNYDGIKFISDTYNKDTVLGNLVIRIKETING